jgi:hypothetical protein
VTCGKTDTFFGKEPYHIYVVECDSSRECATLLERVEQAEPLFTFSKSESDPPMVSEYSRLQNRLPHANAALKIFAIQLADPPVHALPI